MTKKYDDEDWQRADDALSSFDPDADDATIAAIIAQSLTAGWGPPYYLSIFHDERESTIRHIKKMEKQFPDYAKHYRVGEGLALGACPLRSNHELGLQYWQRKNVTGIKTSDRNAAMQWAIDAMLLGYVGQRRRPRINRRSSRT